jgi:hypothetical protein
MTKLRCHGFNLKGSRAFGSRRLRSGTLDLDE